MTTEEIKNLINQKIAGQGSMVDVGGALPTILKGIVDAISGIPAPVPQVQSDWAQSDNAEVDFIKNKPTIPAEVPACVYLEANFDSDTGQYSLINPPQDYQTIRTAMKNGQMVYLYHMEYGQKYHLQLILAFNADAGRISMISSSDTPTLYSWSN